MEVVEELGAEELVDEVAEVEDDSDVAVDWVVVLDADAWVVLGPLVELGVPLPHPAVTSVTAASTAATTKAVAARPLRERLLGDGCLGDSLVGARPLGEQCGLVPILSPSLHPRFWLLASLPCSRNHRPAG